MKRRQMPEMDSIEELVHFWDEHDLTDFEDQLEEVTDPIFERGTLMRVHLKPAQARAVKKIARSQGVAPAELIRAWIIEKIQS